MTTRARMVEEITITRIAEKKKITENKTSTTTNTQIALYLRIFTSYRRHYATS